MKFSKIFVAGSMGLS